MTVHLFLARFYLRSVFFAISAIAALAPVCLHAELVNRWSFNNTSGAVTPGTALTDSVSGTTALVVGTGATFSGSQLTLPGNTGGVNTAANIAGYLDLPNGILSSKVSMTVEAWATPLSVKGWMRLFDFGRSADAGVGGGAPGEITANTTVAPAGGAPSDNLMLTFCRGADLGLQRFEVLRNGAFMGNRDTNWPTTAGQQYHYTMVFEGSASAYGAAGGQLTWYRDGVVIATMPVAFKLADLQDVNNWIGRSNWTWDSNAHMSLNELRIYDHALTQEDITANRLAGPNALTASLVNRWSFNATAGAVTGGTTMVDEVSGAVAQVVGTGSTFTGTALTLPGTTNGLQTAADIAGYVDLPNGLLSSKTNLTLETWATPLSMKPWMRLFDFGRVRGPGTGGGATGEITSTTTTAPGFTVAQDAMTWIIAREADLGLQRQESGQNSGGRAAFDSTAPTTLNQQYHYVITFEDGVGDFGTEGGILKWYRDGAQIASISVQGHLSTLEDVNNWIGRSQWSPDMMAHMALNELRLYSRTMAPAEIAANTTAGPGGTPTAITNRWSFNEAAGAAAPGTALTDSVGGAVAVVKGNGSTFDGTQLTLPGTTNGDQTAANISGYVDLPNGIISSKTNLTLEIWATPISAQAYMRLFDFGRVNTAGVGGGAAGEVLENATTASGFTMGRRNLMLALTIGTDINAQLIEMLTPGGWAGQDTALATTAGQQYHYVMTFEDGLGDFGAEGGVVKWYRDGALAASYSVPFRLATYQDVNAWLGRSQWTADSNAHVSFNEFRVYDYAMPADVVIANRDAGPDAPPVQAPNWTVAPTPANRWTFNTAAGAAPSGTVFTDVISGTPATVRGHGAALNGAKITLPGGTNGNQTAANISAYLDLPNGILSSKPNFTAEAWCAPLSSQTDQRLFDFGRSTATSGPGALLGEIVDGAAAPGFGGFDNLCLTLNSGAAFGQNRLEGQYNGAAPILFETNLTAVTIPGREYHYVLVVENNTGLYGTGGCVSSGIATACSRMCWRIPFT